ncbi:hypothetical protein NKJ26_27490 [Mesorhizobium sp. M0152]|uniref:hypothetical protein n=1 Tax=Mesorhizobium sp. M0152 TaxID=2956898 RepID=UPI00333C34F2
MSIVTWSPQSSTTHASTGVSRIRGADFNRKSRVDRASRNKIAKFPIREFAHRKHCPQDLTNLGYRNAWVVDIVDQVPDNSLANVR